MSLAEGLSIGLSKKQMQSDREELQMRKEAQDIKLREMGYTRNDQGGFDIAPNGQADVTRMQLEQQAQMLKSVQGKMAAEASDAAIEDFVKSGNAATLQRALNNDPILKQTWAARGVQVIENVNWAQDSHLLANNGITPEHYDTPEKQDALGKSMWKYYDGTKWKLGSVNQFVAETGVLRRASDSRYNVITEHMQNLANVMEGSTNELAEKKVEIESRNAESTALNAATNAAKTADELQYSAEDRAMKRDTLQYKYDKLEHDKEMGRGGTNKQKDMRAAEQETNEMLQTFGGPDEFFATDFGNDSNYNKAYQYVAKIERFEGTELSEADKKELNNIRQLIALGDPAKQLTSKDTGVVDSFLGGVNKYLTDEVGGIKAKSAYAAFRNTVRHALFGSALTAGEIKSFNEAFGTLGQKLGPVLQQFRTNLVQVKAKLESMRRNGNPYTMKVRLGVDQDKLDNIIGALDTRIDYLQGKTGGDKSVYKPQGKEVKTTGERPSLDELFNQTRGAN